MNVRPSPARSAFTIIELLVSLAVLAIIGVLVAQITSDTAQSTAGSQKRSETASQARMIFDRLSLDLGRMVRRPDIDYLFAKAPGNDALAFYAEATGYSANNSPTRRLSVVGYRMSTDVPFALERGARGLDWTEMAFTPVINGAQQQQLVGTNSLPSLNDASNWEVLGDYVLRTEFMYRTRGQALPTVTPPARIADLEALVLGVALIDRRTAARLSPANLEALASRFPDGEEGRTISDVWAPVVRDPQQLAQQAGVPVSAASAVRVYQRVFRLGADAL
ncbi:MAG: prepilin-type N-terminal cleavage/methylation domain-containing protein [Terrimicrobiaceae bacterium]|nr:prepilin-type N-terminal cleavage/methylation domain-containing protein [Terrimicrobiaceae bacterium]